MFCLTPCWVNLQKLYKLAEKRKGDKQGIFLDSGLDTSNCGISTVSFGDQKRYPTPYILRGGDVVGPRHLCSCAAESAPLTEWLMPSWSEVPIQHSQWRTG